VSRMWDEFTTAASAPPHQEVFPARMPDGRFLDLPIDEIGERAFAALQADRAGFRVLDALADWLARALRPIDVDVLVAMPGSGAVLAAEVARRLAHPRMVALSARRHPWEEHRLSADAAPIELHGVALPSRSLWLDQRSLPMLDGRRIALIDDVLGVGSLMPTALALLARASLRPVAVAAAMVQADAWNRMGTSVPVVAVFATPLLRRSPRGWMPGEDTTAWHCCPLFRRGVVPAAPPRLPEASAEPG
jgi:adenine/guanine phosphoribosyltransferase-like PRPP-binding protein